MVFQKPDFLNEILEITTTTTANNIIREVFREENCTTSYIINQYFIQ